MKLIPSRLESIKEASPALGHAELAMSLAATLLAIWFHFVVLTHAGPLWRDEAGGLGLATLPHFAQTWTMLTHDAFPVIFPLLLRIWTFAGFGGSDFGLRVLGFIIGCGLLGSLWFSARTGGVPCPLISLSLLAINLTLVRWGDSLRAYGLGSLLIVVTLGTIGSLARKPTRRRHALATVAAILSVQTLYQNAFLVFAACSAGCALAFRRRDANAAWKTVSVGVMAAASLLVYVRPILAAQQWWVVQKGGLSPARVAQTLESAVANPVPWLTWFWVAALLASWTVAVTPRGTAANPGRDSDDTRFFAFTALWGGMLAFGLFIGFAKLKTQPWYWLPLLTFSAACLDRVFCAISAKLRSLRFAVLTVPLLAFSFSALDWAQWRQTNVDGIASHLRDAATPGDLIIVHPWYMGVSFERYYHGAAPWTTLPQLSDHTLHRYDLLKLELSRQNPIAAEMDEVQRTLAGGHRVWLVGSFAFVEKGFPPPDDLPPAPTGPTGWFDDPYYIIWGAQLTYFLSTHAAAFWREPIDQTFPVSPYESLKVFVAQGPAKE